MLTIFCGRLSSLLTNYMIIHKDRYNYPTIVLDRLSCLPLRLFYVLLRYFSFSATLSFDMSIFTIIIKIRTSNSAIIGFLTSTDILILIGWKKIHQTLFIKSGQLSMHFFCSQKSRFVLYFPESFYLCAFCFLFSLFCFLPPLVVNLLLMKLKNVVV